MRLVDHRYNEIDLLKCTCILTVVYIHAISTSLDPGNFQGHLAKNLSRFAVPGFLFAAAFLFDKDKEVTVAIIKKKLIRLLFPYVFCSLCFQFINVPGLSVGMENLTVRQLIHNLIFGYTFGIYYYVFVLFYLYAGSLVLRCLPDKWVLAIWALSGLLLFMFVNYDLSLDITSRLLRFMFVNYDVSFGILLRHPFFHMFAYLSGWTFSLYYEEVISFFKKYPMSVLCCAFVLVLMMIVGTRVGNGINGTPNYLLQILIQLYIYAAIALIITLGLRTLKFGTGVRFVSNCSYGIYLLHFPMVLACQLVYPDLSSSYSFVYAFVAWSAGIAGSISIIYVVKKISGRYSRYLIGC